MLRKNRCTPCQYDLLNNEAFCPKCGKSREAINQEWKAELPAVKNAMKQTEKCTQCEKYRKVGVEFIYCPYCGQKY
jgi:predicted RNA-binding Zn-ribbon protein involved in translation (DUF1610 family)